MPAFFFHYNKPKSKAAGIPIITLHYKGQCHYITQLICDVPTVSRVRSTQPVMVIAGKATDIKIEDGIAHIL